tara:strand:+ start:132 stop:518 length:387 start_codon:yes stop_codon:yes gene_type:complete
MALPKRMRIKGHRTFKYIHQNSKKFYGKLMNLKVAKSCPQILLSHKHYDNASNFRLAITISKKVSKKSVIRNKIRRKLHENFLKNFQDKNSHIPYWVIVNLKGVNFRNDENELLKDFQSLISKTGLLK